MTTGQVQPSTEHDQFLLLMTLARALRQFRVSSAIVSSGKPWLEVRNLVSGRKRKIFTSWWGGWVIRWGTRDDQWCPADDLSAAAHLITAVTR